MFGRKETCLYAYFLSCPDVLQIDTVWCDETWLAHHLQSVYGMFLRKLGLKIEKDALCVLNSWCVWCFDFHFVLLSAVIPYSPVLLPLFYLFE